MSFLSPIPAESPTHACSHKIGSCINGPQPAVKLQVKKEGPNQGRFFYVCREPKDIGAIPGQCGFFLWEDKAQEREKQAALRPVQRTASVWDSREMAPRLPWFPAYGEGLHWVDEPYYGCYEAYGGTYEDECDSISIKKEDADDQASGFLAEKSPGMRKRPAAAAAPTVGEEEDYGTLESDVEQQLVEIVDSSPLRPSQLQQQRRSNAPIPAPALSQTRASNTTTAMQQQHPGARTPNQQRTYDVSASMLTPTSRGNSTTAPSEPGSTKRVKFSDPRGPQAQTTTTTTTRPISTSTTPSQTLNRSPSVGRTANSMIAGGGPGEDYEITTTILNLLSTNSNDKVSDATRQAIRNTLNTYALRMRGVERGRDMTRAALKARDAKEEELKARIEELERERKNAAEKIRALRDGLGGLFGDGDGDGGGGGYEGGCGGGVDRSRMGTGTGTGIGGWKF